RICPSLTNITTRFIPSKLRPWTKIWLTQQRRPKRRRKLRPKRRPRLRRQRQPQRHQRPRRNRLQRVDRRARRSRPTSTGRLAIANRKSKIRNPIARVAKSADAPDLGSGGEILRGSSPLPGTECLFSCTFVGCLSHFGKRRN